MYCCFSLMYVFHICIGLCSLRAIKNSRVFISFIHSTNTYLSSQHYVSNNVLAVGIQQWIKHRVGKGTMEREKNRYKARKWQSWDLNPDSLAPEFMLFPSASGCFCKLLSAFYKSLQLSGNQSKCLCQFLNLHDAETSASSHTTSLRLRFQICESEDTNFNLLWG